MVDDASSREHRDQLEHILSELSDPRIRYLPLSKNVGQILAFFAGLEITHGHFVCPLDPDDRYTPTFIEEALAAHLNPYVICPILSTDQYLLNRQGLISGVLQIRIKNLNGRRNKIVPFDCHEKQQIFILSQLTYQAGIGAQHQA